MIAGFIDASEGSIYFGDKDVTGRLPNKRNTGMVFQGFAISPYDGGAECGLWLEMCRVPKSDTGACLGAHSRAVVGLPGRMLLAAFGW